MKKEDLLIHIKERAESGESVNCSVDFENEVHVWSYFISGQRVYVLTKNGENIKSSRRWYTIARELLIYVDKNFEYILEN